jgi:hypothetical protein
MGRTSGRDSNGGRRPLSCCAALRGRRVDRERVRPGRDSEVLLSARPRVFAARRHPQGHREHARESATSSATAGPSFVTSPSTRPDVMPPSSERAEMLYPEPTSTWYNTAEICHLQVRGPQRSQGRPCEQGGRIAMKMLRLGFLIAAVATLLIAVPGAASEASMQSSHSGAARSGSEDPRRTSLVPPSSTPSRAQQSAPPTTWSLGNTSIRNQGVRTRTRRKARGSSYPTPTD